MTECVPMTVASDRLRARSRPPSASRIPTTQLSGGRRRARLPQPAQMLGYLGDRGAAGGGAIRTGDLGRIDERGRALPHRAG